MVLAAVLALVVFIGGPTIVILNLIPTMIGDYFGDLAQMASRTAATGGDAMATWLSGWTIFYWAWWISWTPFVGMFIARISRGRTIRGFVAGVILIPSAVSLVWFGIFGGAAITAEQNGADLAGAADRGSAVRAAGHAAVGRHAGHPRDDPGRHLLRLRRRRRVDRDGHAVPARDHPSRPKVVVFWGAMMGGVAALMLVVGGERRAVRHPEHHHHHGRTVPRGDDRDVRRADEGPADRPAGAARAAVDRVMEQAVEYGTRTTATNSSCR